MALTEVLPYLGPWLGAVPPGIYALVVHPLSVIWVMLLFLGIHQIEGHIVVPNVMGSALRLHPLLVIFGLLAGFEVNGLVGALIALPMLAAITRRGVLLRAARFESWAGGRRSRRGRAGGAAGAGAPRASTASRTRSAYPFAVSAFPTTRLRRLRRTGALRDLVRETTLSLDDLVQPLFVAPEALPNERLPALSRHTVEGTVRECEELLRAGVNAVILFGIPEEKDDEGSGAWIENGIVQQALRALRPRFSELLPRFPVGTKMTSSRENRAATSLAATRCPWWIGSKVPPMIPTRCVMRAILG